MDAIVIGAGIGGLSAAISLAAAGRCVTLIEAFEEPGGKAGVVRLEGVEVDTGPSVLTLPQVFDELFALAGRRLEDEIRLLRPEPAFRYLFADGAAVDLHHDLGATLDSLRGALGARAAAELEGFLGYARHIWDTAAPVFVHGDAPSLKSLWSYDLSVIARMGRIDPWSRMIEAIESRVQSPHLRMILSRYATYNGSDVRAAPATLNCIAHVELGLGGFGVEGGMHELVRALVRVAQGLGVTFRHSTRVARIAVEGGRATGVVLEDGAFWPARSVVSNAEARHLVEDLLRDETRHGLPISGARSMSAVNAIVRARRRRGGRPAHTVLFPSDYEAEFADIFDHHRPPMAPTVYLCAQESCHGRRGWDEDEPVFVMANAPALPDCDRNDGSALLERSLARARAADLIAPGDRVLWTRDPADLARRFPGSAGAIYGAASHGVATAFQRPPNRVPKVRGLYLASGSAHPGGGLPLAALSGRAAARAALADEVRKAPRMEPRRRSP